MSDLSLLALCGSLRAASANRKLMAEAVAAFAPARWTEGDLRLPLYDGDLEAQGMPEGVLRLARQIAEADAVVIACPEYNKALSGVMKNALDWVSRTKPNPWLGKPVAIMSAADGRAGGERSQFSLRLCLTPFRPRLLPGPELMIAKASEAFDTEGRLLDERSRKVLADLMADLRAEVRRARA